MSLPPPLLFRHRHVDTPRQLYRPFLPARMADVEPILRLPLYYISPDTTLEAREFIAAAYAAALLLARVSCASA